MQKGRFTTPSGILHGNAIVDYNEIVTVDRQRPPMASITIRNLAPAV